MRRVLRVLEAIDRLFRLTIRPFFLDAVATILVSWDSREEYLSAINTPKRLKLFATNESTS